MHKYRTTISRVFVGLALLGISAPGCGPSQVANSPEVYDFGTFEEVAGLYRSATGMRKKPPTSLADLSRSRDNFMNGYQAIEKGDIIVIWGVTPLAEDSPTDEVLAYKSDVSTKGGPVLLKNLTTKKMSADEFNNAPKATGGK
jgi:hypothetical protein